VSTVWHFGGARLWRAAYLWLVASSFRTVPFYRERWALDGRTDPVVVPGKTGTNGGAISPEEALRRVADLVPLSGGSRDVGALLDFASLGETLSCDRWHLNWTRVYVRETPMGLAFSLLRQRSPRLVDIVLTPGSLGLCPRHGTPVVSR
jgi:hypothetical protein